MPPLGRLVNRAGEIIIDAANIVSHHTLGSRDLAAVYTTPGLGVF